MSAKQLSVRLYGNPIGVLKQDEAGKISFTYNPDASFAISHSLPLQTKPFEEKQCLPFFNGLLPENEETRTTLAAMFRISATNDFSLLEAIGGDCAGALSFVPMDTPITPQEFLKLDGVALTEEEWLKYVQSLPKRPLGNSPDNARRLSLAGAQDKTSVTLLNGKMLLPRAGTPSTHILKTPIQHIDYSVLNEFLCMNVAKQLELDVADCTMYTIKGMRVLLIKRYDRMLKDDVVKRLHQEDFCQALAVLSKNKYQAEGGPNFATVFKLLLITDNPVKARLELARRVMFNFLIGNNDAHAKNSSLLYKDRKPVLAPAYDLLSTAIYPELTTKMAMYIGSSKEAEWVNAKDWQLFCQETELSFAWFKKEFIKLAHALPDQLQTTILHSNLTKEESVWAKKLLDLCAKNSKELIHRLEL